MNFDEAVSLIGEGVRVTLVQPGDGKTAVIAEGRLLSIDEGGQVVILDEMGFVHYCWPMLDVEAISDDQAGGPTTHDDETEEERRERFRPLNDHVWGEGNWIECDVCPRDDREFKVFHHRRAHG